MAKGSRKHSIAMMLPYVQQLHAMLWWTTSHAVGVVEESRAVPSQHPVRKWCRLEETVLVVRRRNCNSERCALQALAGRFPGTASSAFDSAVNTQVGAKHDCQAALEIQRFCEIPGAWCGRKQSGCVVLESFHGWDLRSRMVVNPAATARSRNCGVLVGTWKVRVRLGPLRWHSHGME